MTQQEQQLLSGLIERINGTQLPSKDMDAERMLSKALGPNPDALYILCQTVLVQQFALDNAQRALTATRAENDKLKQTSEQPQEGHGSFLGNLFGLNKTDNASQAPAQQQPGYSNPTGYAPVHDPAPAGYPQGGYPPQAYPQQGYPVQGYPGQGYPAQGGYGYTQPGYGAPPMGGGMMGGGGGFLQGAMQTAAGVVAGEFAFRAIEDVFHGGFSGGRGFEGGGTEVVNNYYEDSGSRDNGDSFGDRLRDSDGLSGGISSDIEDRRGESHGFLGSDGGNDGSDFADNSSGFDDSNNFDDGGSFDDGGGSNDDF